MRLQIKKRICLRRSFSVGLEPVVAGNAVHRHVSARFGERTGRPSAEAERGDMDTTARLSALPAAADPAHLSAALRMVAPVQSSFLHVSICRCDHSAAVRIAGRLQRFIAAHLSGPGWVSQRWDAAGQRRTGRHAPAAVSAALSAE